MPYQSTWPACFEVEAQRLSQTLGPALTGRTEHIGSTAVPGLAAKPTIDILLEVPSLEIAERDIVPLLEEGGYVCMWTRSASDGHIMCVRGYGSEGFVPGEQVVHVHLAPPGHVLWERLLFRDYLRAHPDEAQRYADLKRELAIEHREDREAYTEGKTAFVVERTERERRRREAEPR